MEGKIFKDNFKIYFKEIVCENVDWTLETQNYIN
jgi:hypothetical protein